MFQLDKNKAKEPQTKLRAYRLPIRLVRLLVTLKNESGMSETQIVVQMIEHCVADVYK